MTVFLETNNIILPNTYLAKVKRKTPILFAGFFFLLLYPTIQYLTTPCMFSMGPRNLSEVSSLVFPSCIFILASFVKMSAKVKTTA